MTQEKVKMKLQGHEKFALREGWLNKGLWAVKDNPGIFQGKQGPDILGIGNNMVKSLRYWLKAFGLIEECQTNGARLTDVASIILEKDVYFEDIFTLWVLHSFIAKNLSDATTWYMYFNRCDSEELEKEHIEKIMMREVTKYANGQPFSDKSLKNDIDVLLNMYSRTKEKTDPEDKVTSPFSQLGLIKKVDGKYAKIHPDRRKINEWNILYELSIMMNGQNSISIEKAIFYECGLAAIYNITSVLANDLLDRLDAMGYVHVDRTAGLDIIYRVKPFTQESVLREYYDKHR